MNWSLVGGIFIGLFVGVNGGLLLGCILNIIVGLLLLSTTGKTMVALAIGWRMTRMPARMPTMPMKSFQPQAEWSRNIPTMTKMPWTSQ